MTAFDRSAFPRRAAKSDADVRGIWPRMRRLGRRYAAVAQDVGIGPAAGYAASDLSGKLRRKIPAILDTGQRRRQVEAALADVSKTDLPLLAIRATGGIGDYIVIARFLRDLTRAAGFFEFDLFCSNPAVAKWVFAPLGGLVRIHPDQAFDKLSPIYPTALDIGQMASVRVTPATVRNASGTLARLIAKLAASCEEFSEYLEVYPFRDGELADLAVSRNLSRRNALQKLAGVRYRGDRWPLQRDHTAIGRFGLPDQYFTVHNGYDGDFPMHGGVATKCYPHFREVIANLKMKYPDVKFVQIGVSTSRPIDNVDFNLIGRTNLLEATAIIAGSLLHLDNEGGLVHIASCVGTRSVVVFGPTNQPYFSYPLNINVHPTVCGNCWWATDDWMQRCPAGYAEPRCMTEQDPIGIADRAVPNDFWLFKRALSELQSSQDFHTSL